MLINCTTKGCMKTSDAWLNKEDNSVRCTECGNEINVTPFFKRTLEQSNRIIKTNKSKPWTQYCANCKGNQTLYAQGNQAYCEKCGTQIIVTSAFLQGLKNYLDNKKKYENEGIE